VVRGDVVPTPTLPDCVTTKSVLLDEPTAKLGTPAAKLEVSTEKRAHGVVELMPVLPAVSMRKRFAAAVLS
jgi:hypothetical protein